MEILEKDFNRLLKNTNKNGMICSVELGKCWEWMKVLNHKGYGRINISKKIMLAHRVVWLYFYKEIPKGLFVLHKCDNRKCVNPNHLFLGTNQDNTNDMIKKNRLKKGKELPHTRLFENDVTNIKQLYLNGVSQRKIAKVYGVAQQTISKVINK